MCKLFILGLVAFATVSAATAAQQASFENYKVFRIMPTEEFQVEMLRELEDIHDGYSYWKEPTYANQFVDMMVAPNKFAEFYDLMSELGVQYEIYINDVQQLIQDEKTPERLAVGDFEFNRYHTLDQIYQYLDNLAASRPKNVAVIVGGKTYEGRQIKGVKLSFGQGKPGIVIEGGIHAREWISPATVLYLIDRLLNSPDQKVRSLAERHDWYIFPSFNPDGYAYTHSRNRLWRKTRKPYTTFCYGTDPNRNWAYKWMNGGASSRPCDETFAGTAPFSDIESKTMSDYLKSISNKFYAYIAFHSYSQLLLFPYGHTKNHLENYDELLAIGTKTINALKKRYGTQYITGNIAETIYIATGSTVDWVKGTLRKQIAYTYELRDKGRYGFLLPPSQIIPTGEETLDSLVALFEEAALRGHPKK